MRSMASDVVKKKNKKKGKRTRSSYTAGNPIMQDIGTFRRKNRRYQTLNQTLTKEKILQTSER
jgi:hypothetical protein